MVLRAALKELIFEFEHNFSGKSFQSLLLLATNEFSAASTPTRGVRSLNLCAIVVLTLV
jgi:hypothetical protein